MQDESDQEAVGGIKMSEWISVKDKMPQPGRYVACIAKRNPFSRFMPMVARIEKNGWANPITEQYISEAPTGCHYQNRQRRKSGE